jgi:hypothetical protein
MAGARRGLSRYFAAPRALVRRIAMGLLDSLKGMFGRGTSAVADVADDTMEAAGDAAEAAGEIAGKAGDAAADVAERAKDMVDGDDDKPAST